MVVRPLLLLLALFLMAASTAASSQKAAHTSIGRSSTSAMVSPAQPKPLRGVPLTGATGLRLLVANDPPILFDVDTGRITPVSGLSTRDNPALSVLAVGKDAVVWLDRRAPAKKVPAAEIYVVRHGRSTAARIASGWDIAPAADGQAVWVKSFADRRRCVLRELALSGHRLRSRPVPCSTRLINGGSGALLVQGSSVVDPLTSRTLLRTGGIWAIAGKYALTSSGCCHPLTLTDLRTGKRRHLPWPSQISGIDQAAVRPNHDLLAIDFANPAYQDTQVMDAWLLDPAAGSLEHLPDMPATVALKFTSMSWTSDGRLVWLAETAGHVVVAVWRPGEKRIAVRRAPGLPVRDSGSDSFVVWTATKSR